MELTKKNVAVKVTDKNREKLRRILDMFGIKTYSDKTLDFKNVVFDDEHCLGSSAQIRTLIKLKQLKQILAKEHLKKGDVVIAEISDIKYIIEFDGYIDNRISSYKWLIVGDKDVCKSKVGGRFDKFIRFATEEEKALLEPKDKFAELKEAFKNGAEIEYYSKDKQAWVCNSIPYWFNTDEYRIKPKQPLLKSEDGFDLFENDDFYGVIKEDNVWKTNFYDEDEPYNLTKDSLVLRSVRYKAFKHKENALKWIDEQNKPAEVIISPQSTYPLIVYKKPVNGNEYIHIDITTSGLGDRNFWLAIEELREAVKAYDNFHGSE